MKNACGNGDCFCSLYVNGSYQGEDAIGKLMHDFGCKESKDIYYPELAKGVKHFKEEGRVGYKDI